MNKFFNIEQGEVDRSNMKLVGYMDKLDGSLISTYLHNGELKLKTKRKSFKLGEIFLKNRHKISINLLYIIRV